MKRRILLFGLLLINTIFFACAPKVTPLEKAKTAQVLTREVQSPLKEVWEVEWQKTLNLARQEGRVVIATGRAAFIRDALSKSFKEKYGIDISWIAGRTEDLIAKMKAERNAGIYSFDFFLVGGDPSLNMLKGGGLLQSLRAALILPEVKDEKAWLDGKLPFLDSEEEYVFASTLYPQSPFTFNTDLVPNYKEEFASYYDLLNPQWKGKILSDDIIHVGSALKWFSAMIEKDFGPILGLDFMKALAKQDPVFQDNSRLQAEWILRGKYPIGLNLSIDNQLAQWKKEGIRVPVVSFTPKEGGYLTAGGQNFTFIDKASHPNAAKVFLNWVFSREGQIVLSRLTLKHSSRIDILEPKEIDPFIISRDPKLNYPKVDVEKYVLKIPAENAKLAQEIFGHLYGK